MDGLAAYVLRRLLFLPVTLLIVSFCMFFLTRWGPGDPISIYSGQYRDQEAFERVRDQYGLDEPIMQQYGIWLKNVTLHGDFGPSFRYRDRDIPEIIGPRLWVTVRVNLYAFFLVFLVGIPAGVYAATKQGTAMDPLVIGSLLILRSIPVLVLVPILIFVFAVWLDWLPPGGFDGIFSLSMVLPTIALTIGGFAGIARLTRTSTLFAIREDFVRTARAKGLTEGTVIWRHVVRNSVVPIMTTVVGLELVGLMEGALFVEILLGIPGIGSFIFEAVRSKDYNVILTIVLLGTTAFVLANLVTDIALAIVDPRIRLGQDSLR
jgi:ABC-type dipeptide/oligopeptide/nickel transport system permease component